MEVAIGTPTPGNTTSGSTLRWVTRLFAKLHLRYGNRWSSQWPTDAIREAAIREWSEVLADVDPHTVASYLQRLDSEWPPCAAEVRAACKPRRIPAHQPYKRLPAPARDPATAADKLATVRAALRGSASVR